MWTATQFTILSTIFQFLIVFFFSSHWWPVLIIILFRLLNMFASLSNWNHTTFFWMSQKFYGYCSKNYSTLLCLTIMQGFILLTWVIYDPFLFSCCADYRTYFSLLCKWTLHFTAFKFVNFQNSAGILTDILPKTDWKHLKYCRSSDEIRDCHVFWIPQKHCYLNKCPFW